VAAYAARKMQQSMPRPGAIRSFKTLICLYIFVRELGPRRYRLLPFDVAAQYGTKEAMRTLPQIALHCLEAADK
jgi:hypothetical protein